MQQLIRISEVFAPLHGEILERIGVTRAKRLGTEYYLFDHDETLPASDDPCSLFIRWHMLVQHAWPCCPDKMEDFIEKSCHTLRQKFAPGEPQNVHFSSFLPGSPLPYYKRLATQLRSRCLQVFPPLPATKDPESQNPNDLTLFGFVGKEGLYAGLSTPRACGGFYAGGSKFISQQGEHSISRAGAKIAEALHFIQLHHPALPSAARWLELGASPGGMTAELLHRGYSVTAVDRAPLDSRIAHHPQLDFYPENAATFIAPRGVTYDALLCDLNGDAEDSLRIACRQIPALHSGSLIVFTLKNHKAATLTERLALHQAILRQAAQASLQLVAQTHLTYNRNEFTLFWKTP